MLRDLKVWKYWKSFATGGLYLLFSVLYWLFRHSYPTANLVIAEIIVGFVVLLAFPTFQSMSRTQHKIVVALFAILLAIVLLVQTNISYSGNPKDPYAVNRIQTIEAMEIATMVCLIQLLYMIAGSVIAGLQTLNAMYQRSSIAQKIGRRPRTAKHVRSYIFAFLCLCWGVFWLTFYPGIGNNDAVWILFSPLYNSRQHPYLYCMIESGLINLGVKLGGGLVIGAAIYSVTQIVFCSFCASYCIDWLYKRNYSLIGIAFVLAFLAVTPMVAFIAVAAYKDSTFAFALMIFIPLLIDAQETQGKSLLQWKNALLFLFTCSWTILIRNNGIFVVGVLVVYLLFLFRKQWKRLLALLMVAIAFPYALNSYWMKTIVKGKNTLVESMGVPLQQIAMVIASDGVITEEQRQFIDQIMPVEEMKRLYAPCSVDALKWGEGATYMNKTFLDENGATFLRVWAEMLIPNFGKYVEAYLMLTYGFWAIEGPRNGNYYTKWPYLESSGILIEPVQIFSDDLQRTLCSYYKPAISAMSAGTLLWLVLFLAVMTFCSADPRKLLAYVPCLLVWLTVMISAPQTNVFRYVWSIYISLPVFMCITVFGKNRAGEVQRQPKNSI